MKKILTICLAAVLTLAVSVTLAACGGAKDLAKPVLTVNGTTVSWAAVPNAKDYTVNVGGADLSAAVTGTSFSFASYAAGAYAVKVRANTADCRKSQEKRYEKPYKNDII